MPKETERADKFLWSVRLYKTRNLAAEACKKKQVLINGIPIKPARPLKSGEDFSIKHPPVFKVYSIIEILHNRISAKLVSKYLKEITPQEFIDTLNIINKNISMKRDRGTGRPTKKDRRDLKNYFE